MSVRLGTSRRRWLRLHRRIAAAGRVPAKTLEGCERQVAMLDRGELQPLPAPSEDMRRVMAEDERQRDELYAARFASEDEGTADYYRDQREWDAQCREDLREGRITGPESLPYVEPTTEET